MEDKKKKLQKAESEASAFEKGFKESEAEASKTSKEEKVLTS